MGNTKGLNRIDRKSLIIRPSGRSTDFISPSFGYGCVFNCSYCYMKRHKPTGLDIADNTEHILSEIYSHSMFADVSKPNQTHDEYITYDISCNEDFSAHLKYHDWNKIFKFFMDNNHIMGSFATKYANKELLSFNPQRKIRVRMSLMPQIYADVLEPNTTRIEERIEFINKLYETGYDVHINFSPVIVYDNWLTHYEKLFMDVNNIVNDSYKKEVRCEVIFLTHNKNKHEYNLNNNISGEYLLHNPDIQEDKISQYGGNNIRYKAILKAKYIKSFIDIHDKTIPWNTIRYIF